jgi:cell division transport system permease protein
MPAVIFHVHRALQDLKNNRFLNTVAVVTIALAMVIVGAFALVFYNAERLISDWKTGLKVVVFLKPGIEEPQRRGIEGRLGEMAVVDIQYISKEQGLERLRGQLKRQASLLDQLKENPLPDAFEVRLRPDINDAAQMEAMAGRIEALAGVEEVAYGQPWMERFISVYRLFTLAGWSIGALFCLAAVFIVANTIRLVLYNRREEIEIMRLVGATDAFIKAPFYVEALIQGAVGGLAGSAVLLAVFSMISASVTTGLGRDAVELVFLPAPAIAALWVGSVGVGVLGCVISLKQFMRT